MKRLLTTGLMTLGVLWTLAQPAQADWVNARCTYELTNETSRRIYFFLNTKRTSLAAGETLRLNTCDNAPFPRLGLFQAHPFFSSPTIVFDAQLGNGYALKTIQLFPGENKFTESNLKLSIQSLQ